MLNNVRVRELTLRNSLRYLSRDLKYIIELPVAIDGFVVRTERLLLLDLDRDNVPLSVLTRDLMIVDFGRAKNRSQYLRLKSTNVILRGLLAKKKSFIDIAYNYDILLFSFFFSSIITSLNINENYTCAYKRSSLLSLSFL